MNKRIFKFINNLIRKLFQLQWRISKGEMYGVVYYISDTNCVRCFTEEKIDGHWRRCIERLRPKEYYYYGDAKTESHGHQKGEKE